jgi:hypothetical protein
VKNTKELEIIMKDEDTKEIIFPKDYVCAC